MSRFRIESSPQKAGIFIDGERFGRGYATDFIELACSGVSDGDYFLLTCGCGEPGCAGLTEPIEVRSDEEKVYWHVIQPAPERWFTFTKSDYRKELKRMVTSVFELSKRSASHIGYYGFDRERLREFADSL